MYEEKTIQITDNIEKIMCENLSQRTQEHTKKLTSCEDCMYYNELWLRGRSLHCCGHNTDKPVTSRNLDEIGKDCPINHTLTYTKKYIKKYGIIHEKPTRYHRGSISVVDFSGTTYEWDGNNPNVDWRDVATFYYTNQKEADIMMELALDYYKRFNLEDEWVPKHCYG